jgi:hypothetical protein
LCGGQARGGAKRRILFQRLFAFLPPVYVSSGATLLIDNGTLPPFVGCHAPAAWAFISATPHAPLIIGRVDRPSANLLTMFAAYRYPSPGGGRKQNNRPL